MAKHVLIIGGGAAGLSTAYAAARRGHRVTVVDDSNGDDSGCSYGNAGMIVPSHFVPMAAPGMVALALRWMWSAESPFYIRPRPRWELLTWMAQFWRAANAGHVERSAPVLRDLHLASRSYFEQWAAAWGDDFGLEKKGLLMLCNTEHGLEEEAKTAEQARRLGVEARVLSARETAEKEPALRMTVAGSVYFPLDCHLTPARFMASLKRAAQREGAAIVWNTSIRGFRVEGRRVVAALGSNGEDIPADEFVLCGGVWSTALARALGLAIPMQAGKGYSLTLHGAKQRPELCAILCEARVAVTPLRDGALRFGGTLELTGSDAAGRIDPARVRGIVRSVAQYYPEFADEDFREVRPWSGLRPCSPDGLPYLGRFARFDNLGTVTGHAMMGISLGPVSGELMADILSGETPSLDITALNPDRYA